VTKSEIFCFEGYIRKVFHFADNLKILEDRRVYPSKSISGIFMSCFYGSCFRLKSIASIEEETRKGCLSKRVESISDDTIQYGLNHLEVESVQDFWNSLSKRAKRSGMLRNGQFSGHIVGVLDCIEVYSSYKRRCSRCLVRHVKSSNGEDFQAQYYHKAIVLSLAGYDFPIPIGMEIMDPGEGEINCALRLLDRLVHRLGKRFLDIVIGDSAYCTPHFFSGCEKMGIIPGAVLKENQPGLLKNAVNEKNLAAPMVDRPDNKEKLKLWDLPDVTWNTANKNVRVIYAEREVRSDTCKGVSMKGEVRSEEGKEGAWIEKKRVFAFSKQIDHLSAQVVYRIGVHRWDIDAKLFMDMSKHWHLKHKTLHFEKSFENLLSIRLISYMLFMFFLHRHINARRKRNIKSMVMMAKKLYRTACQYIHPGIISRE